MTFRALAPAAAIAAALIALATLASRAGTLAPPAGPIAPTDRIPVGPDTTPGNFSKTYIISQPGSYYLTANLDGEPGKHGISIESDNVTLDLAGFALIGNATLPGSALNSLDNNIVVSNGIITGWNTGVSFSNSGKVVRNVLVSDCDGALGHGIVLGTDSLAIGCASRDNTGLGISVGRGSTVTNCVATGNGDSGIKTFGGVIRGCVANSNATNIEDVNGDSVIADTFAP